MANSRRNWICVICVLVAASALVIVLLGGGDAGAGWISRHLASSGSERRAEASRKKTPAPVAEPGVEAAPDAAATAEEQVPHGDKGLAREESVRGRVIERSGNGVPDAIVTASWKETRSRPYEYVEASRVRTEPDGSFVLGPLERRQLQVLAVHPKKGVGVATGQTPGAWVEIVLAPGARIHGTIRRVSDSRPVAGARVVMQDQGMNFETGTDAEGHYELAPLPVTMNPWKPPRLIVVADGFLRAERSNVILRAGAELTADFALRGGATLRGKVLDARTRNPVAGAVVGEGWEAFHRTVATAEDGSYALPDVEISPNLVFTVRADGYLPQQRQSDGTGTLDFELDASLVVEGTVRDPDKHPVAGAHVYLHRIRLAPEFRDGGTGTSRSFAISDAQGRFRFPEVLPGQVAVIAFAAEHAPGEYGAIDIPVGGPVPEGIDVTLKRGVTVEGEVRDRQDHPLPSIRVQLQRGWGRIRGYTWAGNYVWNENPVYFTDEQGAFRLKGAVPGKLWLSAYDRVYGWTGTQLEGVEGQRITDLVISFAGASISGSVVTAGGEPVPGAWVYAMGPKNMPRRMSRYTNTDGLGRFKLGGLEEGLYDLNASTTFGGVAPRKDVAAGTEDVELKLKATRLLRGEVTSARTGRALERFTLNIGRRMRRGANRVAGSVWQGEIRTPDGRFERPVAPATYVLTFKAPGHAPAIVDDVVVEEGVAPQPVFVTLESGGGIRGTARDQAGKPLRNAWVRATVYRAPGEPRQPTDGLLGANDRADAGGRYFIQGLAPGTYLLQLNLGRSGSASAQVTVTGSEMVLQDLRLVPTGTVVLHAVDAGGKPVPGVAFYFRDQATNRWLGWAPATNAQGFSTSQPLPMGAAMVQAWHRKREYVVEDFPVTVEPGKTITVEVGMRRKEPATDPAAGR